MCTCAQAHEQVTILVCGKQLVVVRGDDNLLGHVTTKVHAQLEQLVARDVHAVLSGSGRIVVHATGKLDASVPGTGTILYSGNPAHVKTSISGQGTITRK